MFESQEYGGIGFFYNLANGLCGTIVDIILDPHESQLVITNIEHNTVHLQQLFFNLISLNFPSYRDYNKDKLRCFLSRKNSGLENHRCALWLIPAYAFTDFKSQGQTTNHVIVDLGKTVQFTLSPFNAYVALSRSKGRDTIRLLRDFEDNLFTRHPSENLREEELRLTQLAESTKTDYYSGKYTLLVKRKSRCNASHLYSFIIYFYLICS